MTLLIIIIIIISWLYGFLHLHITIPKLSIRAKILWPIGWLVWSYNIVTSLIQKLKDKRKNTQ